jgi:Flp pilus assembly protein TadG
MKRSRTPANRCTTDDGAILVEAAMIFPILFYMLFGVFEIGMLFRSYLTVGNGLRAGIRTAAIAGDDVDTDYRIIQAVKTEMAAIDPNSIVKIVVYRANPPSATSGPKPVPAACADPTNTSPMSVGSPDYCNVYVPSRDFATSRTAADYNCLNQTWSTGWCPTDRFSALKATGTPVNGPPDWVGVTIVVNHKYFTGLFGKTKTLSDTMVAQIEPKSLQ